MYIVLRMRALFAELPLAADFRANTFVRPGPTSLRITYKSSDDRVPGEASIDLEGRIGVLSDCGLLCLRRARSSTPKCQHIRKIVNYVRSTCQTLCGT